MLWEMMVRGLTKMVLSDSSFLFDIFGLKMYIDDVLIVSLLFFLYQEQVQDDGLFIVLILLLLSWTNSAANGDREFWQKSSHLGQAELGDGGKNITWG